MKQSKKNTIYFLRAIVKGALSVAAIVPILALSSSASPSDYGSMAPYRFTGEKHFVISYSYFSLLKGDSRTISIDSLKDHGSRYSFTPFSAPIPSIGFSSRASWIKITTENSGTQPIRAFLQFADAGIDELTFYHVQPETTVSCTTGAIYPFNRRDVQDRNFVFHCVFSPKNTSTIFLRCKSRSSLELPVSLMDEGTFLKRQWTDHFISGIFYGILCFFCIAALYLSFIYRDANFRNFAVFILHFCILLAVRDGIFFMYLWPEIPALQDATQNFFFVIVLILGILFCIHFFKAERMHRWVTAFGYILVIFLSIGLLISFIVNPPVSGLLLYAMAVPTMLYAIWISVATFRDHDLASRVCFFSWSVFFLIITVRIFIYSFSIRTSPTIMNFLHVGYNYHVGILAVAIMTSIAMSFRLRLIEKERHAALLETATLQRKTLELKLSMLQARVQPHFLFNTLNTIANYIVVDPPAAERAIVDLSEFYRMTLRHASRSITRLKDEVDLVKRYLVLEKMKFGDRLDFSFAIDKNSNNIELPSMSLQVLVENSLKHGIHPKIQGGSIRVSSSIIDGSCRIVVDDSGGGFRKHQTDSGTGLANLRSRLELVYHGDFTFQIIDKQESGKPAETGVTAILTIPLRPVMVNIPDTI
jgi:sensor histidine kinase YesM